MRDQDLETSGGLQRRLDRHSYDRLLILSDGVFAIAITLAAFEIKVPDTWHDLGDLWTQLRHPISTYFISFALVASFWTSQRTLFARLVRVDSPIMLLTLLQLIFVALIPVVAQLYYGHEKRTDARSIYAATLAICGYLSAAMWGYAALRQTLMHAQSRAKDCWLKFSAALIVPLFATWIAVMGSLPTASFVALMVLALSWRLILRGIRRMG
jgi:uncharacterized membrane protein